MPKNRLSHLSDSQFLNSMRSHGDPVADAVVEKLLVLPKKEELSALTLFCKLIHTTDSLPEGLPDFVADYFESTQKMPAWADRKQLNIASGIFSVYGPEIILVLFCKSLPLSYSCWRGAEVLISTGRLTSKNKKELDKLNRRIMETAQFVLNVLEPSGFSGQHSAIRTIQKIRLIHASIRYFISETDWDAETYGIPINQEDMAGTLMSFSWVIIEGLSKFGILLTDEQQQAYIHCWKVTGHFLGLEEGVSPDNVEQAKAMTEAILNRQSDASEAGVLLTKSLIQYMRNEFFFWPTKCFPAYLMRLLLDKKMADALKVPSRRCLIGELVLKISEWIFCLVTRVEDKSPVLRKLIGYLTRHMLRKMVMIYSNEKKVRFVIPPSLSDDWVWLKKS